MVTVTYPFRYVAWFVSYYAFGCTWGQNTQESPYDTRQLEGIQNGKVKNVEPRLVQHGHMDGEI